MVTFYKIPLILSLSLFALGIFLINSKADFNNLLVYTTTIISLLTGILFSAIAFLQIIKKVTANIQNHQPILFLLILMIPSCIPLIWVLFFILFEIKIF